LAIIHQPRMPCKGYGSREEDAPKCLLIVMPIEFTRINNDGNGNPRYVCHFLDFCVPSDSERFTGLDFISRKYDLALSRSRQFGGRKFHNKQYGGGIVFNSYNIDGLGREIEAFVKELSTDKV
jgi:hypothetical protein